MRIYVVALLGLATACSRDSPPAGGATGSAKASAGPAQPVKLDWVKSTRFEVVGTPAEHGEVSAYKGKYHVSITGFPKGTAWSALDKKGVMDGFDLIDLVDLTSQFADLPADPDARRDATIDPKATLAFVFPDGATAQVKLPPVNVSYDVDEAFKKIQNGPVVFGNEPATAQPNPKSIYSAHGISGELLGRAKLVRDIDAISTVETLATVKGTKTCSGYKDSTGKPSSDVTLQLKETEATLYDRRGGATIDKKVFAPDPSCPMFAMTSADNPTQDSNIPHEAIHDWLRSHLK